MKQLLEEKIQRIVHDIVHYGWDKAAHGQPMNTKQLEEFKKTIETLVGEEAINTDKVTRVEVIDHAKGLEEGSGRVCVYWKDTSKMKLSFQDEGRTLKVFISNPQDI